jgi:YfiR/HmsC-like
MALGDARGKPRVRRLSTLASLKRSLAFGVFTAASLACVLAVASEQPPPADGGDLDLEVKAIYLYRFAPFVSWPARVYERRHAPLVICVQGLDPFGPVLDRAAGGQWVGPHPVLVRRLERIERGSGCHIAYLAGGPAQSGGEALLALEGEPVLTVTDEARGEPVKGIVHLLRARGKVRFSIDTGQAGEHGVAISSKLLALALEVKR